jgi:hypothetical protein
MKRAGAAHRIIREGAGGTLQTSTFDVGWSAAHTAFAFPLEDHMNSLVNVSMLGMAGVVLLGSQIWPIQLSLQKNYNLLY